MAGLVLMLMVAVMAVVLLYRLVRQKPVKKLLFSYSIVLGSYLMIVSCTCGPNPKDVAVMKPMAEKISDYIVKHGIPESLKDIPELPYVLEGCERDSEFGYQQNCKFKSKTIDVIFQHGKYTVGNDDFEKVTIKMKKSVNNTTETGVLIDFEKKNGKFVQVGNMRIYSGKDSGICNPMRQ